MEEFEKYYKQFYGDLNDSEHYLICHQLWQASAKRTKERIMTEFELIAKDHPNFAVKDLAAYIVKRLKK